MNGVVVLVNLYQLLPLFSVLYLGLLRLVDQTLAVEGHGIIEGIIKVEANIVFQLVFCQLLSGTRVLIFDIFEVVGGSRNWQR
jgi:hypothetical protein